MDRQERDGQHNVAATQTHAPLQTPAQTYTFGNKEVSLQEFLKLKSPKFTGRPTGAAPLKWDEFTKLFMDNFLPNSQRQNRLFNALAPNMGTMTYSEAVDLARKIDDKGREEHATFDIRKKAKIGGSYRGDLGANHIIEN
ncbi:hypothetical protein H5410_057438 [Solanum commersonii]|uniref:Uncharacterized protein n=1 Tax=Solanum commersonii TaxID=4109 RepID=A0A9J5WQL0_SOLCO|nr:hypothetical protein H5410_057438 [Solanum commersonii]